MSWHRLRHRQTGQEQTVASLAGISDDWEVLAKLPREPTEAEIVVGGKIVPDPGFAGRQEEARLSRMTLRERQEEAIRVAMARMKKGE